MIIYKDIIQKLKKAGYNTGKLRIEGLISESTIQSIRDDGVITTKTIDKICELLNCQPGDIIAYIPEEKSNQSRY